MKNNHKIITKISLALMIVGLKFIKPATTAELRSVGSSEPTASNAETAGDVSQTVHITLLNLAGEELGSYTVGRNDTLAELNKNVDFLLPGTPDGDFLLPGIPATLDQSRVIGDILREQDPTGESDVLTLEYVRCTYTMFRLDFSLLDTNSIPERNFYSLALDPEYENQFLKESRETKIKYREECRQYVENKLGLLKDLNIKMNLLATKRENGIFLYVTNGDSLHTLCRVPINEMPRVLLYCGKMDPTIFKMLEEDDDFPVRLDGSLNAKFGKVIKNISNAKFGKVIQHISDWNLITIDCDDIPYTCIYSDNEYVLISKQICSTCSNIGVSAHRTRCGQSNVRYDAARK